MHPHELVQAFEALAARLGIPVRYETMDRAVTQGRSSGGLCRLRGQPIILVDEVLAVGDAAFKAKCYTRIEELLAGGRTLFFVSHSEKDLLRFCRRGLYLDRGRLVLDGPIRDVVDRYNADYGVKA